MILIIFTIVIALYVGLGIGIAKFINFAVKASRRRRSIVNWVVGIVMYLIPFWDDVPTVVGHAYLCKEKSGIWIYRNGRERKVEHVERDKIHKRIVLPVNDKFSRISIVEHKLFGIYKITNSLLDKDSNRAVVMQIYYRRGYSERSPSGDHPIRYLKFWLRSSGCEKHGKNMDAYSDAVRMYLERIDK